MPENIANNTVSKYNDAHCTQCDEFGQLMDTEQDGNVEIELLFVVEAGEDVSGWVWWGFWGNGKVAVCDSDGEKFGEEVAGECHGEEDDGYPIFRFFVLNAVLDDL